MLGKIIASSHQLGN